MSDSKKFDYFLSRHNVRESTSLTLATVASSASLVLLGLPTSEGNYVPRMILGILFVCFGFSYNEITRRYSQNESIKEIRKMIENNGEDLDNTQKKVRRIRYSLINILLLLPILGWTFSYLPSCSAIVSVIIVSCIITILVITAEFD